MISHYSFKFYANELDKHPLYLMSSQLIHNF